MKDKIVDWVRYYVIGSLVEWLIGVSIVTVLAFAVLAMIQSDSERERLIHLGCSLQRTYTETGWITQSDGKSTTIVPQEIKHEVWVCPDESVHTL